MNFEFLLKKVKICLLNKNQETYTQKELNELYELLDMSIASKYSYIFKTLLMSFLYMPIFPLSIAISLIGFIFGYFLEKFNFSKMYKRPDILNSKICEFYSNYFTLNFFMLAIGDFIFLEEENTIGIWSILNVIIFSVLFFIPYNQIFDIDFIGIKESELTTQDYEQCYFTFFNDYEKTNPMTKKEGIKNFMLKLEKEGLISRSEYSTILSNFDNANLMETYYKARKNFGNSMAQQTFMNMGQMSTLRKTNNRRKSIMDTMRQYSGRNKGQNMFDMIMSDMKKKSRKKTRESNHDIIIEERDKESETENKSINNSINISFSRNSSSIQETEKNNTLSDDTAQNVKNKGRSSKNKNKNMKRRKNIYRMGDQEEIDNLVSLYNNPFLFGIKNLCDNANEEEEEDEESEEESENSEEKQSKENKESHINLNRYKYHKNFENIKSVEEQPIISEEKKLEEKVKKKVMKIEIKKKVKIKKKIKVKIKVKKVKKQEPQIDFNNYNYDWLKLINK